MADSQRLTSWLLENSERLNLQATEFTWPREWGMAELFDFQITIEIQGQTFIGRGTATNEDTALVKAGAEAIERAFCTGHGISTLGVAVQTDEHQARVNSLNELFERDAFFSHYYLRKPFAVFDSAEVKELKDRFSPVFEKLHARNIACRFFEAGSSLQPVILCIMSGINAQPQFGGVIGLGSNDNLAAATLSAFLEAARNVANVIDSNSVDQISEQEFSKLKKPRSIDRQRLSKNIDYWKSIEFLFPLVRDDAEVLRSELGVGHVELMICPFEELKTAPVFVCRAKFDEQDLLRPLDKSPTSISRLKKITGNNLTEADLESKPHFLG
jgi:hypothetical protein